MKLIFHKSTPGRAGLQIEPADHDTRAELPAELLRDAPAELPEVSELDVVRHFTDLSRRNFGVDSGFYPLGSCTMKYNPKFTEQAAAESVFPGMHPQWAQLPGGGDWTAPALDVLADLEAQLAEICGMAAFTSQPMAGANGELTGVLLIAAYHRDRGTDKRTILVPDSAHGTNPASAAIAGFEVKTVESNDEGVMDLDALDAAIDDDTAGIMLTCPNTLGLFNPHVKEICDKVHAAGGLTYYDGANLNAILGRCRPGDMGFDVVHVNLHKTFATPHGGGGPGAGPVGVSERLVEYLPVPTIEGAPGHARLDWDRPKTIGRIAPYYGNFAVCLKAYAYILRLGAEGLRRVADHAVLNANYLRARLRGAYELPYDRTCMHECVFSANRQLAHEVHAVDIAKALLDRGIHPMTVYFPLIVAEAMMVEPTETESPETLDAFVTAMTEIAQLAETDPQAFARFPAQTPVTRLDETRAARQPDLTA